MANKEVLIKLQDKSRVHGSDKGKVCAPIVITLHKFLFVEQDDEISVQPFESVQK
jgi:hypothetical protein